MANGPRLRVSSGELIVEDELMAARTLLRDSPVLKLSQALVPQTA